jgi:hypothetical protein
MVHRIERIVLFSLYVQFGSPVKGYVCTCKRRDRRRWRWLSWWHKMRGGGDCYPFPSKFALFTILSLYAKTSLYLSFSTYLYCSARAVYNYPSLVYPVQCACVYFCSSNLICMEAPPFHTPSFQIPCEASHLEDGIPASVCVGEGGPIYSCSASTASLIVPGNKP